MSSKLIIIV